MKRLLILMSLVVSGLSFAPSVDARLQNYGRLVGSYTRSNIDDDYTATRHFEVFVRAPGPAGSCPDWRIDINLQNVKHRIVPIDDQLTVWRNVFSNPNGFVALPFGNATAAKSGALDLMRHSGVLDSIQGFSWSSVPLIQGTGVSATATRLTDLFRNASKIYAFGETFSNVEAGCVRQGLHNIHQNQGSTRASVGSWQDGAIIVEHLDWMPLFSPINWQLIGWTQVPRRTALFTQFNDQSDFANLQGIGLAPTVEGGLFSGTQYFGPFNASQFLVRATALQLNAYDPRFELNVYDQNWNPLASSNGSDVNGVIEFVRTYNAGPVWFEVDTAWGSAYEIRTERSNE